ncbi:TlpA disulfide reductase family protein [Sphingobacterium chuzhouense]|uniref:AhpC/TSA family protein n=1 Tax=Sphingobacterium chuzhouense TaxID=1742264 RepID=A0ABR7XSV4_9SPHI|nr:TlpA disulfide reductase family protein [Sphingobacterium chuzhouense]MBD1421367.1 AhpC/TSA family protein [Sphingobacterium chuzhouense]
MKTGIFLTNILALIFLNACNTVKENSFILTGRIDNSGQLESVMLYEGETFVDSIILDENGNFYMEGIASEPTVYELHVEQESYMLVVENGEKVEFNTDLNAPDQYTIQGSETSAKMKELNQMRDKFQEHQMNLQREFEQRLSNGEEHAAVQNDLIAKDNLYTSELSEQVLQFSRDNEDNLAGFFGMLVLYSVDPIGHEEVLVEYAEKAQRQFPNNQTVQSFATHMEEIKPLSIGQVAPDFGSTTPEGKEVKLSDLRGQYVLLDFWAAWCTPCRHENPNIVEQYHQFKDKGFTVFGVSLDRDREAWLKAIKDDKLGWMQVSDLKMWDSEAGRLYNITAIPASFMIDPDGKIVGKNLRGPALKQFLEKNL